jgi:hypothetical protein
MSISAFGNFANAKLFISVPTAGETVDSDGNVIPGSTTLEISAMLLQDSRGDKQPRSIPEDHINDLFLTGYLVDPPDLPENVKLPLDCEAEVSGVKGRVWIPLTIKSPFLVDQILGLKIQAYWRIQT